MLGPYPTEPAMDRLATSLLLLFGSSAALAAPVTPRPDWERHFDVRGVEGAFVLLEPMKDRLQVWNEARARRGYLPASTFKIPNAVIGLETGAIGDEREVFRWDRKPKLRAAWEADHTLASGMRESVVWMFQEVARRTGKPRMREWLDRLEYGNRDVAGGIDQFWLQGGLRITALEQVAFLHRLAEGRLPATQRAQRLVRDAMVVEKTRDYTLYAKTGTGPSGPLAVHWWVGWIERRGRPEAVFAINFTPGRHTAFADRFAIARAILADAGYLPSESPRA
jgi:beta-lactamase class D